MLLPDISMVGYLGGPRLGSFIYKRGLGAWLANNAVLLAGTVLVGHVGMDRIGGYGLKHTSGFKDTHLQRA